jgi:probable HAF family extracellular repeat protein
MRKHGEQGIDVLAYARAGHPDNYAVWSQTTGMVDLNIPGSSLAYGINDQGQVVGDSDQIGAFLWQHGTMVPLGFAEAFGINDAGQIVGSGPGDGGETSAFLWEDGHTYDLDALVGVTAGWRIGFAEAINDRGQIVCMASRAYGEDPIHALLLTPDSVPKPGVPGMLARLVFAGGVGFLRRRHARGSRSGAAGHAEN